MVMKNGDAPSVLKVAIIEDDQEIRDGLAFLINQTTGYQCTGAYGSVQEAWEKFGEALPDVALVYLGLPGMSGSEGIGVLKERFPGTLFLVLTVYNDDDRIFSALCAGACGYLLKKTPPDRLLESIRQAADGGSPISPEVAVRVIEAFRRSQPSRTASERLTPGESRVMELLVQGHSYKTAAAKLNISVNTISYHIRRIYEKLHVHSKSEAVVKALEARLVRPG